MTIRSPERERLWPEVAEVAQGVDEGHVGAAHLKSKVLIKSPPGNIEEEKTIILNEKMGKQMLVESVVSKCSCTMPRLK